MKTETLNKVAVAVVVAAVVVAAAALVMAVRLSDRPDETRVLRLIDERLAETQRGAAPLDEARVIALIEERLPGTKSAALSDRALDARIEKGIVTFVEKQQRAERERPNRLAQAARPVGKDDHIRGNPNAPVALIEYSDFECPFCKRFHATAKQVVNESNGQVKWIYRHFPIDELHSKARKEAAASECAAELGGNEAFWKFADRFYELTPSNNRTDTDTVLPQIAREIGLDAKQFAACLASGRHDRRIEADRQNAVNSGGNGTPWSIIVSKRGKQYPLSGAQPYAAVKQLVDLALREK